MSKLSPEQRQKILDSYERTKSYRLTVVECQSSFQTVKKVVDACEPIRAEPARPQAFLPEPAEEAGGLSLPLPEPLAYEPYDLGVNGVAAVLADPHIPYHDIATVRGWVEHAKRMNAAVLVLLGDVLDCHHVSRHCREMSAPRMAEELDKGRQFLEYLRATFPRARIVFKEGNHEERLRRYLSENAPDLADVKDLSLPSLLKFKDNGVEWVTDRRRIHCGKLTLLHGHEYKGGHGDAPAKWLYAKTRESAMCGHFHKQDSFSSRTVRGREHGSWSLGSACFLHPAYMPQNQWTHGWAVVEVAASGDYHVHMRRKLADGTIV